MQTDNPEPRDKGHRHLACAIFCTPLFAYVGGIVQHWLAPPPRISFELLPPLSLLLALIATFFLALPWARKQTPVLRVAIGKAIGVAILTCFGWGMLALAILFATCASR